MRLVGRALVWIGTKGARLCIGLAALSVICIAGGALLALTSDDPLPAPFSDPADRPGFREYFVQVGLVGIALLAFAAVFALVVARAGWLLLPAHEREQLLDDAELSSRGVDPRELRQHRRRVAAGQAMVCIACHERFVDLDAALDHCDESHGDMLPEESRALLRPTA